MVQQAKPKSGDANGQAFVDLDRMIRVWRRVVRHLCHPAGYAPDRRWATVALQGFDDALRHNGDALLTGETGETRSEKMRDEALMKSYGAVRRIKRHALALAEVAVSSSGVMARTLTT